MPFAGHVRPQPRVLMGTVLAVASLGATGVVAATRKRDMRSTSKWAIVSLSKKLLTTMGTKESLSKSFPPRGHVDHVVTDCLAR